jgi:hypothetical protein
MRAMTIEGGLGDEGAADGHEPGAAPEPVFAPSSDGKDESRLTGPQGFGSDGRLIGTLKGERLRSPETEPDMTRLHSILALLVASTALGAVPAMAAQSSMPGSPPSGAASRDIPGAVVLPGKATPMPLPIVSGSSVSRGLLDKIQTIEGLGTVTLHRDGTVTRAPASDDVRDAFEHEGNT